MKGLAAVVVVPLAALAFVHVATSLMPAPAPAQAMYPQSILWAGRVFTSKAEFAGWLARHDESYAHWVKLHPGASPWEPRPAASIETAQPKPKTDDGGIDFGRGLPILYFGLLAAAVALAVRARGTLVSAVAGPVGALTVPRPTIRPPDIRGAAARAVDRVSVAFEREPPVLLAPVVIPEEYDDTPPGAARCVTDAVHRGTSISRHGLAARQPATRQEPSAWRQAVPRPVSARPSTTMVVRYSRQYWPLAIW